ncbi:F-box/LRR-repeat protein 21-like [Saccostrea echinata]|uniref:F-box/LRR-repeat protein 21-like n=1 Tax=Saccostrea echinata TaxID=191078 RepID=UPI002A83C063|nr:F-box/LRR-repeat protein 21-like [Saccostrea echinata]
MNVEASPDFGNLPIVVWIHVLEYLTLKDRYSTSLVCSNIYNAFNHPTLWQKVKLDVGGNSGKHKYFHCVKIPQRNFHLVRRFARMFHDVTFSIWGPLHISFGEWNTVLEESINDFKLGYLTLNVGGLRIISKGGERKPLTENMKPMVDLLRNQTHLKALVINSWPVFAKSLENPDENIFQAAIENEKIKDLRKLSLFKCESTAWSERRPHLISEDLTLKLADHFKNLTHLALRSPMITSDLIKSLSCRGRERLQQLQITINFIPENEFFKMPEVNESVWKNFSSYNSNVKVKVLVLSRVPHYKLECFLRPACPVYEIKFGEYIRSDKEFIAYLADTFNSTLDTFEYNEEDGDFERELITLVENSDQLCRLKYRGKINCQNVIHLAELRKKKWESFHFIRKNIYKKNVEKEPEMAYDSDQVIAKNNDGVYVLVNLVKFHEQVSILDSEEEEYRMIEKVSENLGRHWFPDVIDQ